MTSMRKGANLYLKYYATLDRKSVPTSKSVKTPGDNQNLSTCKSSPINTHDSLTQYSTPSSFKRETIDQFIDDLIEGKETKLSYDGPPFSIHQCLNQELESKQLPPIELRSFTGNPIYWPEFIENFKFCVHLKSTISIWKDYLVH